MKAKEINDSLNNLKKKDLKVKKFEELLASIDSIDEKKKTLWKEIYENATTDRENASILFTDSLMQVKGNAANHTILGPIIVKYIERMSKANDQILKLAEIIGNDEKPINMDEIYSSIDEDR